MEELKSENMLSETSQTQKVTYCILSDRSSIGKSIGKWEQIKSYQEMEEEGIKDVEELLNGYRVFLWGDEKILKLERADGYTTLGIH